MKPVTPIQDLFSYLKSSKTPATEENIRRIGKMLSMTESELALALAMKDKQAEA